MKKVVIALLIVLMFVPAILFTEEVDVVSAKTIAELREELLPYRDDKNCERTYLEIKKRFYKKEYREMVGANLQVFLKVPYTPPMI